MLESLEHLIGLLFLYRYGVLSTSIEFLDIKDAILILQGLLLCVHVYISILFASKLCMYVVVVVC